MRTSEPRRSDVDDVDGIHFLEEVERRLTPVPAEPPDIYVGSLGLFIQDRRTTHIAVGRPVPVLPRFLCIAERPCHWPPTMFPARL